ncbi:MAG: DUF503 domain-containing protein [Planctomycetota bacterium]|jgi:uncharacterized protein YlxP (DUF503 family)
MAIAVATLRLSLPGAHSLKDKRRVVKSLKDRLRRRFNVSVAEMDHHDIWQSAVIGVCVISPDGSFAQATISKVADLVGSDPRLSLVDYEVEMF